MNELFTGVYRPIDAARYIRADLADVVPPSTTSRRITRWIQSGFSDLELARKSGREMSLTFEDLVSTMVQYDIARLTNDTQTAYSV